MLISQQHCSTLLTCSGWHLLDPRHILPGGRLPAQPRCLRVRQSEGPADWPAIDYLLVIWLEDGHYTRLVALEICSFIEADAAGCRNYMNVTGAGIAMTALNATGQSGIYQDHMNASFTSNTIVGSFHPVVIGAATKVNFTGNNITDGACYPFFYNVRHFFLRISQHHDDMLVNDTKGYNE